MVSNKNDSQKTVKQPIKTSKNPTLSPKGQAEKGTSRSYSSASSEEKIKNNKKVMKETVPKDLDFQIIDWNTYHEMDGDDEEKYVIQLFGRTEDDKDVCLKVTGYTPFFYVEVPNNW